MLKRGLAHVQFLWCGARLGSGHHECGLGEAVAGIERLPLETALGEGVSETCEPGGADRLSGHAGHLPVAQIECVPLFRGHLPGDQLIPERGRAGPERAVIRDRLKPPKWLGEKSSGDISTQSPPL